MAYNEGGRKSFWAQNSKKGEDNGMQFGFMPNAIFGKVIAREV